MTNNLTNENLSIISVAAIIFVSIIAFNPVGLADFVSDNIAWLIIGTIIAFSMRQRPSVSKDKSGKDRIGGKWASKSVARSTIVTNKVIIILIMVLAYIFGIAGWIGDNIYPSISSMFLKLQIPAQVILAIIIMRFIYNSLK